MTIGHHSNPTPHRRGGLTHNLKNLQQSTTNQAKELSLTNINTSEPF